VQQSCVSTWYAFYPVCSDDGYFILLLGNILLAERCRTDDLLPDLHVPCLPPRRVDSKVLGLNVIIDRSQPGGSWTPRGSPPVRWRSQCGGDDTVMVFLLGWPSQVAEELQPRAFTLSETGEQPVMLQTVSFVICLVYGIRKILRRQQVSKASRRLARVLVTVHVSHP